MYIDKYSLLYFGESLHRTESGNAISVTLKADFRFFTKDRTRPKPKFRPWNDPLSVGIGGICAAAQQAPICDS